MANSLNNRKQENPKILKMVNIVHRIGIKAPIANVYSAFSTIDGVAGWWTREVTGVSNVGGTIHVRFLNGEGAEVGAMDIDVIALEPDRHVHWRLISGPDEWIGTDVSFALKQDGEFTIVLFSHNNWRETVEFMAHCSMKWATFLLSAKQLLENGCGRPSPIDVKIDNWN